MDYIIFDQVNLVLDGKTYLLYLIEMDKRRLLEIKVSDFEAAKIKLEKEEINRDEHFSDAEFLMIDYSNINPKSCFIVYEEDVFRADLIMEQGKKILTMHPSLISAIITAEKFGCEICMDKKSFMENSKLFPSEDYIEEISSVERMLLLEDDNLKNYYDSTILDGYYEMAALTLIELNKRGIKVT